MYTICSVLVTHFLSKNHFLDIDFQAICIIETKFNLEKLKEDLSNIDWFDYFPLAMLTYGS